MKKKANLFHHSACISLLLFTLIVFRPDMAACAVPTLDWSGEEGLWNDGVQPDYGIKSGVGADTFTFQVSYQDASNHPPLSGYPKVHIKRIISNELQDISGSPFTLTEVDTGDTNYQDGKLYSYSTTLSPAGNDYKYSFVAYDSTSAEAYGSPANDHTLTVVDDYVWVDKVLGNDTTGDGSEFNPYQTIGQGVSVASAGQAVRVRGGTIASPYIYNESFSMVSGVHLVSDNGNGGDSEAVYDDPYSTYQTKMLTRTGRVRITGTIIFPNTITEDVVYDGFTIDYIPGKYSIDIVENSPVIRNNVIRRGDKRAVACIEMQGTAAVETAPIIENNLLHSVGGHAIGIANHSDALIQDNEIWNCEQAGIGSNSKGLPTKFTVRNNHVFNNGWAGIANKAMAASSVVTIKGNIVHDNGLALTKGAGIYVDGCCSPGTHLVTIGGSEPGEGNTIYNNFYAGIRVDGANLLFDMSIENNDIYDNGTAGMNLIDVGTTTTKATVMDNSIHGHVNGAGINIGGASYLTVAYNSIYDNKAGVAFNMTDMPLGTDADPPSSGTVNIEENDIYSNNMAGIAVRDAITGAVTIAGNDIYQNDRGGIGIINSCDLVINRNEIHNNVRGGIHTGTDVADDFYNDDPSDCTAAGVPYECCTGLETGTCGFIGPADTALLTVTQNKVHNNGLNSYGGGIDLRHASGSIINNLIYENRMGGIRFGDYIDEIVNNTVADNGHVGEVKYGGGIIYDNLDGNVNDQAQGSPPASIPIRNNIAAFNVKTGIRDGLCRLGTNLDRDYNLLYGNNPNPRGPTFQPPQLNRCWGNANEIFAEPLFVDRDNDDYRLQAGPPASPAVDAGDTAYGVDVNLPPGVGTSVIDMGAYGGQFGIDW